jgi:dihydrofolate reductase
MRKLIFAINLTLDGCCDHTRIDGTDELHEHYANYMRDVDLLVFGRKTYELMVPFRPEVAKNNSGETKAMNDFAHAFASKKIVVFSRSLEPAEGENTRIVRTNLEEEIRKLKQEPGKAISIGGIDLSSQLIEPGLIDEYRFVVQPIVAGAGRRLFDDLSLPENVHLKLAESKALESGSVALRYVKQ